MESGDLQGLDDRFRGFGLRSALEMNNPSLLVAQNPGIKLKGLEAFEGPRGEK